MTTATEIDKYVIGRGKCVQTVCPKSCHSTCRSWAHDLRIASATL